MRKSLFEISLDITEPEYRAREELSYSTLARFERDGFNKLNELFDRVSTDSLLFGSCVDTVITGGKNGWKDFNDTYVAYDDLCTPKVREMIKYLSDNYGHIDSISKMSDEILLEALDNAQYYVNYSPSKRISYLRNDKVNRNYQIVNNETRTVISTDMLYNVQNSVRALKTSDATAWYFSDDDSDPDIERLYQLKFAADFAIHGKYRCMSDLIVVNHKEKHITFVDLKTSSHYENEFYLSYLKWRYDIQSRLYSRIIIYNCMQDDYFKDFTFSNYRFIVVNKNSLLPLVWKDPNTHMKGTIKLRNNSIILRDPFEIGEELTDYLITKPLYPFGIKSDGDNDIAEWIEKSRTINSD